MELKKTILDRMVHLLSRNFVVPVVQYIAKCVQKQDTDISLIRHFVTEVRKASENVTCCGVTGNKSGADKFLIKARDTRCLLLIDLVAN